MYFVVDGKLHLNEIGINILPGAVVGELGMLAPARTRTQTLVCTQTGSVLEISYDRIEQLYYQNPQFGFYFLRLSTARLFENIGRLEGALAERDREDTYPAQCACGPLGPPNHPRDDNRGEHPDKLSRNK